MKNTILNTLSKLANWNIHLDKEVENIEILIKNMIP